MLNDQTIRKLRVEGWRFVWNKQTWHVGAEHDSGGRLTVCEIKPSPHFDFNEVGSLLAERLNNCLKGPIGPIPE